MNTIKSQTLAGIRLDSQGERNTKEVLESFAALYAGRRMPLNQQHDLSLKSPGYVENVRVIPDAVSPGDWSLVGDAYFDGDALEIPVSGFSISFLEVLRRGNTQDIIHVYLPYPYYNDSTLIDEVFEEGFISVGRWAKKAADPTLIALVGGVIVFFVKPIWEDLYKTQIAPHVYKFFSGKFKKLQDKSMSADFIQYVVYNNYEIQVLLIPARGKEEHCFSIDKTNAAMELVYAQLTTQDPATIPASKMFLQFDEQSDSFSLYRIEHKDGSLSERV